MKESKPRSVTVGELRDCLAGLRSRELVCIPDDDHVVGELTTSYGTFNGRRVFCVAVELPPTARRGGPR